MTDTRGDEDRRRLIALGLRALADGQSDAMGRLLDEAAELLEDQARTLALFVRFVRMNPQLAGDDPAMIRAFDAYQALELEGEAEAWITTETGERRRLVKRDGEWISLELEGGSDRG